MTQQDKDQCAEAQIELPPLPEADYAMAAWTPGKTFSFYNDQTLQAYARQAIAHDRQQRGEAVHSKPCATLHITSTDTYPEIEVEVHDGSMLQPSMSPVKVYTAPQPAEPATSEMCETCQGNGEVVTDWERYKHPRSGDVGDEAVAECPDCDGQGVVEPVKGEPSDEEIETLKRMRDDYNPNNGPMSTLKAKALDAAIQSLVVARYQGAQPAASAEPVAVIGSVYQLMWASGAFPEIVKRQNLKPGSLLYAAPVAAQPSAPESATDRFMADVGAELKRARAKFPGDRIMTIALAEEFGELAKAMLDESGTNVWKEAVQTAVMAARVAIDGDSSVDDWRSAKGLDNHRCGGSVPTPPADGQPRVSTAHQAAATFVREIDLGAYRPEEIEARAREIVKQLGPLLDEVEEQAQQDADTPTLPSHEKLADLLTSIGWRSTCDAQYENLRDVMPTIRNMFRSTRAKAQLDTLLNGRKAKLEASDVGAPALSDAQQGGQS